MGKNERKEHTPTHVARILIFIGADSHAYIYTHTHAHIVRVSDATLCLFSPLQLNLNQRTVITNATCETCPVKLPTQGSIALRKAKYIYTYILVHLGRYLPALYVHILIMFHIYTIYTKYIFICYPKTIF